MTQKNVDLIRTAYEAFGRADIPAVMAVLDPEIDWHVPTVLPQGLDAHGHDEVAQFFQRLGEIWDGLEVKVQDLVASGDRVVVLGRASGKVGGSDAAYAFAHAWRVRDDRAVRFEEYADPGPELLAVSG
jgi:uncharacterized protein